MNGHYTAANLQAALVGDLPANDEESLERHLASCDQCSAAMERLAAEPAWRTQAAALLADDELDARVVARPEWSEADFTVEHLDPSDEPDVLGCLGGYDVLEIIGRGGMGVVLKAYDRELKRCVAIKVLSPHLARSSLARKRFAREAQAAAAVVHPHVLAIHQVQSSGRLPFLVMPLVAGESLAERLAAHGALELKELLRISMQAAAGLAAAHEQGLVHRDVKPGNILLEKGVERTVVADFGLARAAADLSLTRGGDVAGTPEYMSPEQVRGEPLDGRSDLFSLGCVLYEMATGVSPFRSDSALATMRRLIDDTPQSIASLNPECPPWFVKIVERLLEKDPSRRFSSAKEVSDLLENCLAHVQQPATAALPATLARYAFRARWRLNRHRKGILAMFAFLGSGLLGLVLWQAAESPGESQQPPKNDGARIEAAGHGKGDLARLQGTWEGKVRSEHERYIVRFTIEGRDFIQVHRRESDGNETTTRGRIELDESANPKQMTMKVSSVSSSTGPRVPGRIPSEVNAIYKLDEKGLTRRSGRSERPKKFSDKDPGQIVFTSHERREGTGSSVGQATSEKKPTNEGGAKRPDSGSAAKAALEKRIVGTWKGHTDRFAERYEFRADKTFRQESIVTLGSQQEGQWEIDWRTLPPTLVLTITKSDIKEVPAGAVLSHRIVGLDDKRLRFERPEDPELPFPERGPITYTRVTTSKIRAKAETDEKPRRADLLGEWSCDDNALAHVYFTLELRDDDTFTLHQRDTALKFESKTDGEWRFDSDESKLNLRVSRREERREDARKYPGNGRGVPIETLTVDRKDGRWILIHARQGTYHKQDVVPKERDREDILGDGAEKTVNPTFELAGIIREYERSDAPAIEGFAESAERWRAFRNEGKTMWGSEKWMKTPQDYQDLPTSDLAGDCFNRSVFATEILKHKEPQFGLQTLKIMHDGFAELFQRDDMWQGIHYAYDLLGSQLNADADLLTVVRVSLTLDAIAALYRDPGFKMQAKGREALFLEANLSILKRYRALLSDFENGKVDRDTVGFFREPVSVAQVALMLAKQVDPAHYSKIKPTLTAIRFSSRQDVGELKRFLDAVITAIEPTTASEAKTNSEG